MRSRSSLFERKRARIELIPMIDTMVFLLIFFMIASLAMAKQKGIPVSLPSAASAPKATWADRAVVITEDEAGKLYLDKTQITRAELGNLLSARLRNKPELVVVINADENLRHRQVVWLMDEARKAGAAHLAIATNGNESALEHSRLQ